MADKQHSLELELKRSFFLTIVILIGWTLIIMFNLIWIVNRESTAALEMAKIEARSSFNIDLGLRQWATSHGGVYVPSDERTPPNPYLSHVPERDILTPSGKKLTLMNPAYMLRQFMTEYSEHYKVKGKITSLELLNPVNTPDAWEREALQAFAEGEKERQGVSLINGKQYLRFMQPLLVEEGCLKCHGHQGYKVGDIRGGVSVAVPLAPYLEIKRQVARTIFLSHTLVWACVFLALLIVMRQRQRRMHGFLHLQNTLAASEAQLSHERQRLDEIIWATNVGTWEWDLLSGGVVINERWAEIVGFALDELQPCTVTLLKGLVHPDDLPFVEKVLGKNFSRERDYYEYDFRMRHKNGDWVWVLTRGKVVEWTKDGTPLRMSGTHVDISERKHAEEVLERQALVFENIYDGMIVTDSIGRIVDWSPSAERMFGYPAKEILGESPSLLLRPEEAESLAEEILRGLLENDRWQGELNFVRKDGSEGISETIFASIIDSRGHLISTVGVNHDITERKQSEHELQKREEVYHALFENNHSAMLLIDPEDGGIIDANPAACQFYGYSRSEILEKSIFDFNILSETETREKINQIDGAGQQLYFRHRLASGELREVEVHSGPILIHGRELLCSMVYDVTMRKYIEEALYVSERKHKHLAEASPSGIWQVDAAGNSIYVSSRWCEITGISAEKAVGKGWMYGLHRGDKGLLFREWISESLEAGKFRAEYRYLREDGSIVWVLWVALPEEDDQRQVVGWVGTVTDITELKQNEENLRKNEERLYASLQEKEVLLREIHHRVKNNLQVISSLLQLQARGGTPEIVNALAESERRVKVMAHLHEKLYQSGDLEQIEIYGFLCSLVDDLKASQSSQQLPITFHHDIEQVALNLDQAILVGQIFSELLSNAIKHAFPDDLTGDIWISLRRTARGKIELSLVDNGVGLPDDFDTRRVSSLGWQLVHALAVKLGASIEIERRQGTGIRLLFDEVKG